MRSDSEPNLEWLPPQGDLLGRVQRNQKYPGGRILLLQGGAGHSEELFSALLSVFLKHCHNPAQFYPLVNRGLCLVLRDQNVSVLN